MVPVEGERPRESLIGPGRCAVLLDAVGLRVEATRLRLNFPTTLTIDPHQYRDGGYFDGVNSHGDGR